jgi:hypothetical protein
VLVQARLDLPKSVGLRGILRRHPGLHFRQRAL